MLKIAQKISNSRILGSWSENDIQIDLINDVEEGVDQDSASTHHSLEEQDMDMMVDDNKGALDLQETIDSYLRDF